MYKKLLLALGLMALGASLMVAAAVAGTIELVPAPRSQGVTKGGTLRLNVSNTDYEYLDPALSYDSIGWATIYAVNMQLLNYPDKPASAGGNQLVPEAATGFPTVSKDGKTYTFTVKSGLKFSDGSAVTAAAFQRAIYRVCHPDQGSPAVAFADNFGNCTAFNEKKASSLTGITAKGQTLTVKLNQADPTFISQLSMPFFAAVKPNMAIDPKGISVYPSAGPYKIVSRESGRSLVLERNTFYKGTRPANPDRIVITTNTDQNQSLLQVKAGQANHDLGGVPAVQNGPLSEEFGVNKSRYFVNPLVGTGYLVMNNERPTFKNVAARKAVNWAIDRPALLRTRGKFGGQRTDQILPPALPGFKNADLYPLKGCEPDEGEVDLQRRRRHHPHAHDVGGCGQLRADRQVQPRAGGLQGHPEAAAVRRGHQDDGHAWQRHRHLHGRLDRGLLRSVRLHQRAPGRQQHPGREQQQLLVLQQRQVQRGHEGCVEAERARPASRRTASSTWTS